MTNIALFLGNAVKARNRAEVLNSSVSTGRPKRVKKKTTFSSSEESSDDEQQNEKGKNKQNVDSDSVSESLIQF